MRRQRAVAGLFTTLSLLAALWLPAGPGSGELLARSADCGAYDGKVCSKTESCVRFLIYEICTTEYKYYKQTDDGGGDEPQPKEPS